MALLLRDYQDDLVDKLRAAFKIHRSVVLQMPTGSGKTACAGAVAQGLAARGLPLLALVHRHELVNQFTDTLERVGLGGRYGVIAAGRAPSPWASLQVASIQTLHRRPTLNLKPALIVIDECHHARAATWSEVLGRFPQARLLGLTATPARLDGKPLGLHFDHLVEGPSIGWLVVHGWCAQTTMKYVGRGILTRGMAKTAGDYNRKALGEALNRRAIAAPVKAFLTHARDRRAIFFGINTQDSKQVAELFGTSGIKAVHVDGKTPPKQRDRALREFAGGTVQVLCNVDIVSEGTDIPLCDCIIMGRPTLSLVRYLQEAGRAGRIEHGRDALIIDCVGNIWRHGAPDKERRWTLQGAEPAEPKEKGPSDRGGMRVCVHCATVYPASRGGTCPTCGKDQPLDIPEHLDVELLTRDGDTPVAAKPVNVMTQIRNELRRVIREGGGRRDIQELRERFGMNENWERNAISALRL